MPTAKDRILQFIELQGMSVREFERRCGFSNGYLKKVNDVSSQVFDEKIKPVFPELSEAWVLADYGSMLADRKPKGMGEWIQGNRDRDKRPRIPLTVTAGTLSELSERDNEFICELLPVVHQLPSYDFTMVIKGNSMSPVYESGDEVACKRIDEKRFVQWGKPHILDTTQGIILKRIYENGDCIRCVSYNKEYPDILVPKEDIHSMSLVVGSVRITEM